MWLLIAAYAQLRLARPSATDLRRPWEKPAPPNRLTPTRVRRGFRNLRTKTGSPASAPNPGRTEERQTWPCLTFGGDGELSGSLTFM
jgi:hypothetical protein